jgi:hypothetical protein
VTDLSSLRTGQVDAVLFGRLVDAQVEAERSFLEELVAGDGYSDRLDGIAEGLARAVEIIGGDHAGIVRLRSGEQVERIRRAELAERTAAGAAIARARAALG